DVDLGGLKLDLNWSDANDLASLEPPSLIPGLQSLLDVNADQIVSGIKNVAGAYQQATGVDLLAPKEPLVNKTIGELVNGPARPVTIGGADAVSDAAGVYGSSDVTVSGDSKHFTVFFSGVDRQAQGVAVRDSVNYKGPNNEDFSGTVGSVGVGTFSVRFDA